MDLAVTDYSPLDQQTGFVSLLMGNGNGTFQARVDYSHGYGPSEVVVADLNGDGKLDLAVVNDDGGRVTIQFGNGDGTFQSAFVVQASALPFFLNSIYAADLNGDGKIDLAVGSAHSNVVAVLLNSGDGKFNRFGLDYGVGLAPGSLRSPT